MNKNACLKTKAVSFQTGILYNNLLQPSRNQSIMQTNTVHYLKDYRAPDYLVRQTDLTFDIFDDYTRVQSRLLVEPQQAGALLVTRSEEGMSLYTEGASVHEKAVAREVFDVSGAGDTVIATLAVMLAQGADWARAIHVANLAAGIVVGKLGTAVVTRAELNAVLD